ncbi:MAG: hypothetical protein NC124_13775 [Clostridium sp.]|nr:hypothetical protein [Clostridium sp.]
MDAVHLYYQMGVGFIGGSARRDSAGRYFFEAYRLSVILVMVPFLAVASVSESNRSVVWEMSELEMAARFSLRSIVLARLTITGIVNVILELLIALLVGENVGETVLYLLLPYLLTAYGSLILIRNIDGREGIYVCAGFGVLVGALAGFSTLRYGWIYRPQYAGVWFAAVIFLLYLTFDQGKRNVQRMELKYDNG